MREAHFYRSRARAGFRQVCLWNCRSRELRIVVLFSGLAAASAVMRHRGASRAFRVLLFYTRRYASDRRRVAFHLCNVDLISARSAAIDRSHLGGRRELMEEDA